LIILDALIRSKSDQSIYAFHEIPVYSEMKRWIPILIPPVRREPHIKEEVDHIEIVIDRGHNHQVIVRCVDHILVAQSVPLKSRLDCRTVSVFDGSEQLASNTLDVEAWRVYTMVDSEPINSEN